MTTDPCEPFKGLMALEVVGQLSDNERVALLAHLDGCRSCRDERQDLLALTTVLPVADPDRFEESGMPFELQETVLERLRSEARRDRRSRRSHYLLGSAAAASVAAVALVVTLAWPSSGPITVALSSPPGVHATALLKAQSWGTSMELRESGEPDGQVLSVSVRTESGAWWQTGTYRTVGDSLQINMACALPLSKIDGVWVRNSSGQVVLQGYLTRPTPADSD
jgi:hypothetical protein